MNISRVNSAAVLLAVGLIICPSPAFARGGLGGVGGGGGRVGGGGGGGGRPSFGGGGGGASRPSMPQHNISRPSTPNVSRPSMANSQRPATPVTPNISRPSPGGAGNFHPGGGNFAGGTTPKLPPGNSNRPSVRPPGDLKPAVRPSLPDGGNVAQRPSLPTRPGGGDRPNIGERPNIGDRPITNRPNVGDRPSFGNIDRPTTLPATRPRPDRPVIGGGNNNNIVNRPGGGNINNVVNRPGGIHVGDNNVNFNRPGWGLGTTRPWDRPNGGLDHDWGNHWHDNFVNNHYHNWYHGCWHGHWGNNWYAPLYWGGAGWGVTPWYAYSSWGYGASYYNPYYTSGSGYDYSQPIVVNQYVSSDAPTVASQPSQPPPSDNQRALALFDEGTALFKDGKYPQAYVKLDSAQRLMPNDPVIHEVKALSLFALARYKEAAAVLNALLASSPGMDWTSMSALYGDEADYTAQLRKLEAFVKANPQDASAIFVLAYQYLVIGENDSAVRMLKAVVERQPQDATAKHMLAALAPPPARETPAATPPESEPPSTDLVGRWVAQSPDADVELMIADDNTFTWKAGPKGKSAVTVQGSVSATADTLALESKEQGAMVGKVTSEGADKFVYKLAGTPPAEAGLTFARAK